MNEIEFLEDIPEKSRTKVACLYNENIFLREQVKSLQRLVFAQKSERFVGAELILPKESLFNEPEQLISEENKNSIEKEESSNENTKEGKPKPQRKSGGKKPFPENIPREVKIHDLPENEKICRNDLTPLLPIGEDVVEKLDIIPMTMKVIQHRYLKYACPCCQQNVARAKAESSLIPGSMAEAGLLAHITTNKYFFSLPLYRQEALFKQKEIEIPRITMARWMIACGNAVLPLVNGIKKYILSQNVVHCDETPVQVLSGTGKKATAKTYMWVLASGLEAYPATVFQYYSNRSNKSANEFLSEFRGYLQVDGYDGYNEISNHPEVTRVACWAHVRRKFESAYKDGAKQGASLSEEFLKLIQKLFSIDRKVADYTPEERIKVRQQESKPIVDNIRKLIDENVNKIVPRSKLGIAFGYITNEWPHLLHFLNHGLISLSNNRAENAIRPFAVGRKNWLFSDTVTGAQASAALYSLVLSAKENNLPVEYYLDDVFSKLPLLLKEENPSYESLLPWNWKDPVLSPNISN